MNAVSFTAEGFGWILRCIASCVNHFLDCNYYVVSFFIKNTNSFKDTSWSLTTNVYEIVACYYHDFLAFANELNVCLCSIAVVVANFLSKGILYICFTTQYCIDVIESICQIIKGFSDSSVYLLKEILENCIYFLKVVFKAILLILQLGPNIFIAFYESLLYSIDLVIFYVRSYLTIILNCLYTLPSDCLNVIYSVPPKAYYGLLLLICLFYTHKNIIKYLKNVLICFLKVFSVLIVSIFTILSVFVFNIKSLFERLLTILFKKNARRSQPVYHCVQQSNQSSNKLNRIYKNFKAIFRLQSFCRELDLDELQKELSAEKDKHLCVICHDRERNVILFPCRHMCICEECIIHLQASFHDCPLCRNNILSTLHVYT